MATIGKTALVVDDDPHSLFYTQRGLLKLGFASVFTAHSGKEALRLIQQHKVDVVLADWSMPEMSGIDLLGVLRSGSTVQSIPVILVTGEQRADMVKEALELRLSGYIVKPFSYAKLMETVIRVLEQHEEEGTKEGDDIGGLLTNQ
ncbi:MAG: Response regulator SypE [Nitrospira sp.]|nr:MAG: Response regulator SypE [Nitrospira sp.]